MDEKSDAEAFAELFPAVYLRFHRRDKKQGEVSGATRGILLHLAGSGPLTIGEIASHASRAQSVVSEMVEGLEKKGWLERMHDPKDRRRTLVWLSDAGIARLEQERQVLSIDVLDRAMKKMSTQNRRALLRGMRALVEAFERKKS